MVKRTVRQACGIAAVFWLLQKTLTPEEILAKLAELGEDSTDFHRIRCPRCRWQPSASSLWFCADCGFPEYYFGGCGTAWNTFTTRGMCPGCGHQWRWTSCLACHGWSLHEDWYEREPAQP